MRVSPTLLIYTAAGGVGAVLAWQLWKKGEQGAAAVKDVAATVVKAIDPTNPDNVAATAVNSVVKAVTGDQDETLGTWIAKTFNSDVRRADAIMRDLNKTPAPPASQGPAPDLRSMDPADMDPNISIIFGGGA